MSSDGHRPLLARAAHHAERYLETIHERHVGALASGDNLRQLLGRARISTRWLGATSWQGRRAARISICNWSTTDEDIDRSAAAILGLVERANRHTSHP